MVVRRCTEDRLKWLFGVQKDFQHAHGAFYGCAQWSNNLKSQVAPFLVSFLIDMYSIVRGSRHGASRLTALVRRAASSAPTIKIPDDKLFLEYVSEKWSSFGDKVLIIYNIY